MLVARVSDPPVGLEKDGGPKVLVLVARPPVGGARSGAARAENALIETVELPPVLSGLELLCLGSVQGSVVVHLKIRLD
jgi:hypothetical protein